MENSKNGSKLLPVLIIFILLSILLGGYIIYEKFLAKSDEQKCTTTNENTEKKPYDYDNIASYYTGTLKDQVEDINEDDNGTTSFTLELNSNGTFSFEKSRFAPTGYIGNYIIKDNKIILNYLYSTNSGEGKTRAKGSSTITINSDGSLVMTEKGQGTNVKEQELKLTKGTKSSSENDFERKFNSEEVTE